MEAALSWMEKEELDGKKTNQLVGPIETTEAKPLPPGTLAQLTELIALTRALELGKGKRVAIYTDTKYAFLVLVHMLLLGKKEAT